MFNSVVIVLLVGYAQYLKMSWAETIPLILTAILASIPVALPATFTLASALGAKALAKVGVLPTRLSAVDEAATMDVLCSDKTGTLTRNELKVIAVRAMRGFDEAHVLAFAALASSDGGGDPVDAAIRSTAGGKPIADALRLLKFVPFDPATKMSEATVRGQDNAEQRIVKGAFAAIAGLAEESPAAQAAASELEGQGFRVLAVAAGPSAAMKMLGLIALSDPPRDDSAALVTELRGLGVRTVMVTGDAPASPMPNAWNIGSLTTAGVILGACLLAFCAGVLAIGKFELKLETEALRTLAFSVLVFGSQATIYAIRERKHLWNSRPSVWVIVSSITDILIACVLAIGGFAMTALHQLQRLFEFVNSDQLPG